MAGITDTARRAWESTALLALVETMGKLEEFALQDTRTLMISMIRQHLEAEGESLSLPHSNIAREDLIHLARACLRVPGGIRALRSATVVKWGLTGPATALLGECDRLLELEPSLLTDEDRADLEDRLGGLALIGAADVPTLVAEATKPFPLQTTASTMTGAVRQLERRVTALPLLRFLELLANVCHQNLAVTTLRAWIDDHMGLVPENRRKEVQSLRGNGTRIGTAGIPTVKVRTVLLVRVEPVEDGTYSVLAWLGRTDGIPGPNSGPEDVVTLEELKQWLREFVERYAQFQLEPLGRPLIEFAMPASHLNEPVDSWELLDGTRLGARYQVTVRPLARQEPDDLLNARWDALLVGADAEQPAPESVRWLESTRTATDEELAPAAWAWIAVTCPLVGRHGSAVDTVLATGTPVAVWIRGEKEATNRRRVLEGLSHGRTVTQFPGTVRKFREYGWQEGSDYRDLVLLWDDPTRRPPPNYLINAPEVRSSGS